MERDNPRDPKANNYDRNEFDKIKIVQFNPSEGTFDYDITVSLSTKTDGATIYYTTNGSNPGLNSEVYSHSLPIGGDKTSVIIKAFASKKGMINSDEVTGTFTISYPIPSAPRFSHLAGTYNTDLSVNIVPYSNEADIYYTLNGKTPDTNSSKFESQPIDVSGDGNSVTLKALSVSKLLKKSGVSTSYYKINYSYNNDDHMQTLSLADYNQNIVGDWIGNRNCPWIEDINVSFTFIDDTFIAESLIPIGAYGGDDWWGPPVYYGGNEGTYSIYDLYANNKSWGDMSIDPNTWGRMKHISFYSNYSVLKFEYWHFDETGPVSFVLTRVSE
jgi:hypothetical protein